MSTYLVAFVICDFKTMTDYTKTNNISVSVIAAEDKLPQVSRLSYDGNDPNDNVKTLEHSLVKISPFQQSLTPKKQVGPQLLTKMSLDLTFSKIFSTKIFLNSFFLLSIYDKAISHTGNTEIHNPGRIRSSHRRQYHRVL